MNTELQKNMNGWIVEVIAPALIMLMTGSLAFFLVEVFYYGPSYGRVKWVLSLFVFASVLISRISIMEGKERAALFGVLLAGSILFVLIQLTNVSLHLGLLFIIVIWWFNNQLTWDCTVIEGSRDTTDRGLLERFGLEGNKSESAQENEVESENQQTQSSEAKYEAAWIDRLFTRKRKANTPGVWVVILSLAAFPIFGIGQGWIDLVERRQNALIDFCLYLIGGLGLLVTTALIGLQRYLQKRRATMPNEVVINWIASGAMLIFVVLAVAWFLPRPGSEFVMGENPLKLETKSDLGTSKNSVGTEGKKEPGGGKGKDDGSRDEDDQSADGKEESSKGSARDSKDRSDSGKNQSDEKQKGKKEDSKQGQQESGGKASSRDSKQKGSSESSSGKNGSQGKQQGKKGQSDSKSSKQGKSQSSPKAKQQQKKKLTWNSKPMQNLLWLFQWILFLVLLAAALYFMVKNRRALWRSLKDLVNDIKRFLQKLFGSSHNQEESENASAPARVEPRKTFSDFSNPFQDGRSNSMSAKELIRYSFEALEAWGQERNIERSKDQTPFEFVQKLYKINQVLARESACLAAKYSEAAFATDFQVEMESVQNIWKLMENESKVQLIRYSPNFA